MCNIHERAPVSNLNRPNLPKGSAGNRALKVPGSENILQHNMSLWSTATSFQWLFKGIVRIDEYGLRTMVYPEAGGAAIPHAHIARGRKWDVCCQCEEEEFRNKNCTSQSEINKSLPCFVLVATYKYYGIVQWYYVVNGHGGTTSTYIPTKPTEVNFRPKHILSAGLIISLASGFTYFYRTFRLARIMSWYYHFSAGQQPTN